MAKKPKSPAAERATAIADKIADQVRTLVTRDWGEISTVLIENADSEITLKFSTIIRDRPASPGEQAEKDNQIRTTMAFSTKFSDSIECPLPDPNQPELPTDGAGEPPIE